MTRYVALLKGINVGGHKRIAMADLRALVIGLGHTEVATLQAAGNVIFTAGEGAAAQLSANLEAAIVAELGMSVRVAVRTAGDLAGVVQRNPLAADPENPRRYFVGFLTGTPEPAAAGDVQAELEKAAAGRGDAADRIWLSGGEAYFWCPTGFSLLDHAALIERRLGVAVTTRNWNTVGKLALLTAS